MCVVCGCHDRSQLQIEGDLAAPAPAAAPSHPANAATANGDLHFGLGPAGVSVVGMSAERTMVLEANVLGENNRIAQRNRQHFHDHGVLALNLVSSPGAGKTTLLCETLRRWQVTHPAVPVAVIEGDQQTTNDADRIRATGAPAIQVNTGKGCHLDAEMVEQAFARLPLHAVGGILMIENVGNLVCPALWDLGEAAKVAVLSVTEGADKPLKYPDMFAAADLMILNKIDLLPHVDFDVNTAVANARRVNPRIEVIQVSATQGTGMDAWMHWLLHALDHARGVAHDHAGQGHDHGHAHAHGASAAPPHSGSADLSATVTALSQQVAALQAQLAAMEARLTHSHPAH